MIHIDRKRSKVLTKWLSLLAVLIIVLVFTGCFGGGAVQKGWSGVTLNGNTLYVGSRAGYLVSVNVTDGSLGWNVPLETGTISTGLGCSRTNIVVYVYSSPLVSDNTVFVCGFEVPTLYNGKIYAFIPGESQPDRVLDRVRVNGKDVMIGQIVGSLAIDGDRIFFGDGDGNVYGINTRLQPVWAEPFHTGGKIWSTPAVNNGTVYIGSFDKKVYALDEATGTVKWTYTAGGIFMATPVVVGDTVYIGSFDRSLYAIDAVSGELRWSFEGKHAFWATPVIKNGLIYAPCLDGKVYVLNTTDGSKVTEINVQAPVSSSPVLIGDKVIIVTEESKTSGNIKRGAALWAIDTPENQGHEIARIEGEKVYAPLASQGDSVFVHTNRDLLYAIDVTTGSIRQLTIK